MHGDGLCSQNKTLKVNISTGAKLQEIMRLSKQNHPKKDKIEEITGNDGNFLIEIKIESGIGIFIVLFQT